MSGFARYYEAFATPGEENKLKEAIAKATPRNKTCTLPFEKDPRFFGRSSELDELDRFLYSSEMSSTVIYGVEGVGKPQLALEYAWRNVALFDVVLWVSANSEMAIQQSLSYAATNALGLIGAHPSSHSKNAVLVMQWLKTTDKKWLLIFDNIESQSLCDKYWPESSHGSVLVTTTNDKATFCPALHRIELFDFSNEEGAGFLIYCLSDPGTSVTKLYVSQAAKISSMLMDEALLISQIAASIQTKVLSPDEFYKIYQSNGRKSTNDRDIWGFCIKSLIEDDRKFLGPLCFLKPDSIPKKFARLCLSQCVTGGVLDGPVRSALIRINPQSQAIFLPRSFQGEFLCHTRPKEIRQTYFDRAVKYLLQCFPLENLYRKEQEQVEACLPHALEVIQHFKNSYDVHDPYKPSLRLLKLINKTFMYLDNDDMDGNSALVVSAGVKAFDAMNQDEQAVQELFSNFRSLLGLRHLHTGAFEAGQDSISEAKDIIGRMDPQSSIDTMAILEYRLGVAWGSAGDYNEGYKWLDQASKICKGDDIPTVKVGAAQSLYCRRDFEKAHQQLDEAFTKVDDPDFIETRMPLKAIVNLAYGSLGIRSKDLGLAEKHLMLAFQIINLFGWGRDLQVTGQYCYFAGRLRLDQGRILESINHLKKAVAFDEIRNAPGNYRIRTLCALSLACAASPENHETLRRDTTRDAEFYAEKYKFQLPLEKHDGYWEVLDSLVSLPYR